MSFRTKKSTSVLGPARALGGADPGSFPGLVGYWDARDVTGSVTSWDPRASDGLIGPMIGTGSKIGTGVNQAVTQPRYISTNAVFDSGITFSTLSSMWVIGTVASLGSDISSRTLIDIAINSTGAGGQRGLLWYNYSGNVTKIMSGNSALISATGIAQKTVGIKYLWILNIVSLTSGQVYTYTEDGATTTVAAPSFGSTAKFFCGRRYDNASNVMWDGEVAAFGLYTQTMSTNDITALRTWANKEFGVVN